MKGPPAFQFYPSDFLSDENVIVMNNREVGCYIKLLSHCWIEGSIPKDTTRLARLCGESESDMVDIMMSLNPCFKENGKSGRLVNPRLEREKIKQEEYKKGQSQAGKRGNEIRWNKEKNRKPIATRSPDPIANYRFSSSSSSSSSNNKIHIQSVFQFPDCLSEETWQLFLSHRKTIKAPISKKAYPSFVDKFKRLSEKGYEPKVAIDLMIEKGWRWFKPEWLKEEEKALFRKKAESRTCPRCGNSVPPTKWDLDKNICLECSAAESCSPPPEFARAVSGMLASKSMPTDKGDDRASVLRDQARRLKSGGVT